MSVLFLSLLVSYAQAKLILSKAERERLAAKTRGQP